MKKKYIVLGSGFRAFTDCVELSSDPNNEVTMLDPSKKFGNVMNSREVNGFAVDNGVHMFDSIPVKLAEIIKEIMEGQVIDIDFVSESAFGGKITEGFSLPDLSSLSAETKKQIYDELVSEKDTPIDQASIKTVSDFFIKRYGPTAGSIFEDIFFRLYSINSKDIDSSAISTTSLARLKFLDDPEMIKLKEQSEKLDSILAARRKSQGKLDDFVSIYPKSKKGMRGWCENAVDWMENKRAINIRLGEKICSIKEDSEQIKVSTEEGDYFADKIIWSNDNYQNLAHLTDIDLDVEALFHKVPMIFMTLITNSKNIKNFTYIQNFNENGIANRFAAAGLYSNQSKQDGSSFITAECPTPVGSERWEKSETLHENVWEEAKELQVIDSESELISFDTIKIPQTIKMKKYGFDVKFNQFCEDVRSKYERIILRKNIPFFRREIYLESLKLKDYL